MRGASRVILRLLSAVGAGIICYGLFKWLYDYGHSHDANALPMVPVPVMFVLAAFAAGTSGRRLALIAYRGFIVAALGAGFLYGAIRVSNTAYLLAAAAAALAIDAYIRRRLGHPRWFIDENGERQRILIHTPHGVVFNPTTYKQRVVSEATARAYRRSALATCVVGLIVMAVAWKFVWTLHDPMAPVFWSLFIIAAVVALIPTLLVFGIWELIYLSGYQGIEGAKVYDSPPPEKPGLAQVRAEKVHGAASLATQGEALDLLNPR